jgi:hypothetical protein
VTDLQKDSTHEEIIKETPLENPVKSFNAETLSEGI